MKRRFKIATGVLAALAATATSTAASAATSPWTYQFGTVWYSGAGGVAVSSCGNVHVGGTTAGALPKNKKIGQADAFLARFSSSGKVRWMRQFGTTGHEHVTGVAAAPCGDLYVVGYTNGTFAKNTNSGGWDGFLAKISSAGKVRWVKQFGTSGTDVPRGVAVAKSGHVYVTGSTSGAFPSHTNQGDNDGFLLKFTSGGTQKWVQQFGTAGRDEANGVAVDRFGTVFVVADTTDAFGIEVNAGDVDAVVTSWDKDGLLLWLDQFGTASYDHALGVAVDKAGGLFLSGYTGAALPGNGHAGGADAYLARYDALLGVQSWIQQIGTSADDDAVGVAVNRAGLVIVGGSTYGALPFFVNAGGSDGWAAVYDASGGNMFLTQYGTDQDETVSGVAAAKNGDPVVAGGTLGGFAPFSNAGASDVYVMHIDSELTETT